MHGEPGYDQATITRRMVGTGAHVSDEGNAIPDLHPGAIAEAGALSQALNHIPGMVENGLFVNMSDRGGIGQADGRVDMVDVGPGVKEAMWVPRPRIDNPFADIVG